MCIIIIGTNKNVTGSTLHFLKMRVFHMWLKVKIIFKAHTLPKIKQNYNYVATVTCPMNTGLGLIDTRSIATYYAMHNSYIYAHFAQP